MIPESGRNPGEGIGYPLQYSWASLWLSCKESAYNAGDLGSIPGLGKSPGGGNGNAFQYSCLESPHGQRSLARYSPWSRKESDTTERLSTQGRVHSNMAAGRQVRPLWLGKQCSAQLGNRTQDSATPTEHEQSGL